MTSRTPIRLALGLGDQELEQRLRPALDADAELAIAAHCLAAEQIVQAVEAGGIDVAVVAAGLHRLSESVLSQLERSRVAIVLLASDEDALSRSVRGTVLSREVDLSTLRQAIASAARGERWTPRLRPARESHPPPVAESGPHELSVLVVAGGAGSPGRTTVAINLATALGAVAPTALVDLDCTSRLQAPEAKLLEKDEEPPLSRHRRSRIVFWEVPAGIAELHPGADETVPGADDRLV